MNGGLDIAAVALFDATVAWHVEFDRAPSLVLAHHWPDVPNYGDITMVDWSTVASIDVLTGGFPCQDVSAAGRRAGLVNGTRTGLFHEVVKAIDALRPGYVVLENVLGIFSADGDEWPDSVKELHAAAEKWGRVVRLIDAKTERAWKKGRVTNEWTHRKTAERVRASRQHKRCLAEFRRERYRLVPRAFATVLRCLAEVGYDARWTCLRASDVGAPHHRGRVFLLATPSDPEGGGRDYGPATHDGPTDREVDAPRDDHDSAAERGRAVSADTDSIRRRQGTEQPGAGAQEVAATVGDLGSLPGNGRADDLLVLPTPMAQHSGNTPENHLRKKPGRRQVTDLAILVENDLLATGGLLPTPRTTDSNGPGRHGQGGPDLRTAITEIGDDHASATESGPTEVLHDLRDGVLPQEVQRQAGGPDEIPQPEDLRPVMRKQSGVGAGGDPQAAGAEGSASDEVRGVRINKQTAHPPRRPKPSEQRPVEPPMPVCELPSETALAGGSGVQDPHNKGVNWGPYAPAVRRWERVLARPAPCPTELNSNGKPRLNAAFAEYMMGLPEGWVTAPGIGISRAEQLKAIGNGVCPQQAAAALRALFAMPAGEAA